MKYKNLVVGEKVQVKHTHTEEYCGDYFEEGQVFEVLRVDSDGMFKVEGEQFGLGVGYGRPENFRKYKEPVQEQEPTQYKVGDVLKLTRNCVARHGESIKRGLFEVGIGVKFGEGEVTVLTGQGGYGQATLPLEFVHRYKEQDDGQA